MRKLGRLRWIRKVNLRNLKSERTLISRRKKQW